MSDCDFCVDGLQADGQTPCPCQDKAADEIAALQARVVELEVLLTTARQLVTHAATELSQSAQDMSAMRAERALHKAIAAIQEGRE